MLGRLGVVSVKLCQLYKNAMIFLKIPQIIHNILSIKPRSPVSHSSFPLIFPGFLWMSVDGYACRVILARQHQRYKQIDIGMASKKGEQFEVPHKDRIKITKRQTKATRHSRAHLRNFNQSPENSDDEEYQQKIVNRGAEWWGKVDYRFFRQLPQQELRMLMERTTSEELLSLKYLAPELGTFFQQEIVAHNPFIGSASLLRVLFRREVKLDAWERYQLVSFAFKEYQTPRAFSGRRVEGGLHLSSFRYPKRECHSSADLLNLQLDVIDVEDHQQRIKRMLFHDVVVDRHGEQLEQEIDLWQAELDSINRNNVQNWKDMITRMERQTNEKKVDPREIEAVRRQLRMTEVLVCFKRGHSDKTEQMLQEALQVAMIKEISAQGQFKAKHTRLQKLKCLFETDCKICFCTESDDKNPVLYCDSCNTSFHQACYAVQRVPEDEKFYCEVCTFIGRGKQKEISKQGKEKIRKPACQVCGKFNFPMRQLNGHFYHVTCLVLFDLVQIRNYRIQFKHGLSHTSVMQKVVQNEVDSGYCAFCLKESGMKFECSQGCGEWFHPICGYLNGVHFQLVRGYRTLNVTLTCATHFPHRDALNQIYLRRFFCDYRGTADKTDVQFQQEYARELQEKVALLAMKTKDASWGIKQMGKIAKSYKCYPRVPRLKRQRSELALSGSKRDSEQIVSNHMPANSETEITDTRRLLLRRSGTTE